MEMVTLYHIVPKDDGYTFLVENTETHTYNKFLKADAMELCNHPTKKELIFYTEDLANKFIEINGLSDKYKAEKFCRARECLQL